MKHTYKLLLSALIINSAFSHEHHFDLSIQDNISASFMSKNNVDQYREAYYDIKPLTFSIPIGSEAYQQAMLFMLHESYMNYTLPYIRETLTHMMLHDSYNKIHFERLKSENVNEIMMKASRGYYHDSRITLMYYKNFATLHSDKTNECPVKKLTINVDGTIIDR